MKNPRENIATLNIWSRNVTRSTREPTTRAWISANIWRQDGAICSKNRKIVSYHGSARIPKLTVSVPDYGSCSHKIKIEPQQYVYTYDGCYCHLYNNPSYSRILIGSRLWSIRGQMHDWRHHYRVFASAVLKWWKVLRIRIIFYATGQKIRYKKVLPRHWTGSRS